jgi:hypothetical protein
MRGRSGERESPEKPLILTAHFTKEPSHHDAYPTLVSSVFGLKGDFRPWATQALSRC